ncbi:hypothetical protein GQR58_014156 [Nymphon striatum]|nr:hypothetical protein GQR58_014156 [Nymphon striatum]
MKDLPTPVKLEFCKGNFTVRQQRGKFNGVWSGMALEQTYNKEVKTKLLQGIAQRPETISKYLKALPAMTAVSEKTLLMAHMKQDSHADRNNDNLMNISTGETTQSMELIDARQRGFMHLKRLKKQVGQKEKINAFSHEWTKYPSSIFIPDVLHPAGFSMRKGNKSDYGTMLKTTMALQWKEPEELPAKYLQKILRIIPQHCDIVHVVGDRYDLNQETSLKIEERLRRQKRSKKAKVLHST